MVQRKGPHMKHLNVAAHAWDPSSALDQAPSVSFKSNLGSYATRNNRALQRQVPCTAMCKPCRCNISTMNPALPLHHKSSSTTWIRAVPHT
mmetsp:Transcript_37453/g.105759  ORF Transcript_37453/g.105759 Transcript_37453/m.105759 type:complete len:91 (-) Transcript_37453:2234-2506(-)